MATFQTKKDPLLRGVSPTPSKIPVRSRRRPPLPTVKPCSLDQENQDPKVRGLGGEHSSYKEAAHTSNAEFFCTPFPQRLEQKFTIQRPLVDSAGQPKATHQTEKSERLVGSTLLRNPLEQLRPSPKGQNVGPGPPSQTGICWRPRTQSPWLVGRMRWGWWSLGAFHSSSLLQTIRVFPGPCSWKARLLEILCFLQQNVISSKAFSSSPVTIHYSVF